MKRLNLSWRWKKKKRHEIDGVGFLSLGLQQKQG